MISEGKPYWRWVWFEQMQNTLVLRQRLNPTGHVTPSMTLARRLCDPSSAGGPHGQAAPREHRHHVTAVERDSIRTRQAP